VIDNFHKISLSFYKKAAKTDDPVLKASYIRQAEKYSDSHISNQNDMTERATDNTSLHKYSWWFFTVLAFIALLLSIAWFLSTKDYEPALAVIGSVTAFFTLLLHKEWKGLFFGFGVLIGAVLAALLLFFIPQFGSEAMRKEQNQLKVELDGITVKNQNLEKQVVDLEKIRSEKNSDSSEKESKLRQQVLDLTAQIETLNTDLEQAKKSSPVPQNTKAKYPSQTVDNVRIEIINCRSVGSDVLVELMVTNQGADRKLQFYSNSSLTNEVGQKFSLGNTYIDRFVNDVKRTLSFKFQQAGQSKSIQLLDIDFSGNNLQFRNLPIER
jgi:hypothetical protein